MAANTQGVLENLTDGYLAESQQIKGGYFVTNSLTTINDRSIVTGSMCYNTSDNKFYKRIGSDWQEIVTDRYINVLLIQDMFNVPNYAEMHITTVSNQASITKEDLKLKYNNQKLYPIIAVNGFYTNEQSTSDKIYPIISASLNSFGNFEIVYLKDNVKATYTIGQTNMKVTTQAYIKIS